MMMMDDMDIVESTCSICFATFMQGVEDTFSLCPACENAEPLDFDDWDE